MTEIDQLFATYLAVPGGDNLRAPLAGFRLQSIAGHVAGQSSVSGLRANTADAVSTFDSQARRTGFDRGPMGGEFLNKVRGAFLDLQQRGAALEARAQNLGTEPKSYLRFMADALQYQREAELFIHVVHTLTSIVPQITQMQG